MRIKVLVNVVTQFGQYQQGEVDLPEAEAAALLERNWAIPLEETAAVKPAPRRKRESSELEAGALGEPAAEPATVSTETEPGQGELESAALGGPEETAAEPQPGRKQKKQKKGKKD